MRPPLPLVLRPYRLLCRRPIASPRHPLIRPAIPVVRYSSQTSTPAAPNVISKQADAKTHPEPTPEEYRKYNRLAFNMEVMHSELRDMFLSLQTSCDRMVEPANNHTARDFIELGLTFLEELEMHHQREDGFLFPKLAVRMPEFGTESLLADQHRRIHKDASALDLYLHECQTGAKDFDRAKVKKMMGAFSETLLDHLDREVYALRADRIRQAWTLDEFRKIP